MDTITDISIPPLYLFLLVPLSLLHHLIAVCVYELYVLCLIPSSSFIQSSQPSL